jgi:hypothetical protein
MSPREVRYAKNQALFREVNERIVDLAERFQVLEDLQIICECANTGCIERLDVTHDEYARVREHSDWFLITPSHIACDFEQVVERRTRYEIIKISD